MIATMASSARSPQEYRRAFARMLAASAAAMILILAGVTLAFSTFPELLGPVSDDWCERSAIGEPERDDPDCHSGGLGGPNYVDEWDREHPMP